MLIKGTARDAQIDDMTEHFHQILPYDFGLKRPANIVHLRQVKDKVRAMQIIGDICVAEKCLLNALVSQSLIFCLTVSFVYQIDLRERSPIDVLRNELLTNLKPLPRSEGPNANYFKAIYKAVTNTTAAAHR